MIGPWVDPPLLLAIPVGVAFGLLLERSGLASARTIADQLAFRDHTVIKVMLAAIVTAMLGVFWADRLGWLDLARVGIPATDVLPQLMGALVFGAGFAIASLCPGTACAAVGTGRLDGVAVVAGLFGGTLAVGVAWPTLGALAERAPREGALLPAELGLPTGVVVAGITLLAVLALPLLTRLERGTAATPRQLPLGAAALSLGLLAVPGSISSGDGRTAEYESIAREIAAEADHVHALDLAEWIRDGRPGLRVIDVRDDRADNDYMIPGAVAVPLAAIARLQVRPHEQVVLYSDGGTHAAQAWVLLRARGEANVLVLHDGLAAWEDEVLAPPAARVGDPVDAARYARARELSDWFGGRPRQQDADAAPAAPRARRRNTC